MNKSFRQLVANKLRLIRLEREDRIEDLALKSGIAPSTISRYESGKYDMTLDKIEQLLKPYNINLYIFFENIHAKTHNN